jgi:hypothetical protein
MNRDFPFFLSLIYLSLFSLSSQASLIQEQSVEFQHHQTQFFRAQEQEIHRLFEARPILVNQAIIALATNAPPATVQVIQEHLARNAREIGNVFTSLFNPSIGRQIEALLDQAALINGAFGNAIKANNLVLAAQLAEQADANGQNLAEFFGGLFFRISFPTWKLACRNYTFLTEQQTLAYLQNNVPLGEALNADCFLQFRQIGNLINQALDFQINPPYN